MPLLRCTNEECRHQWFERSRLAEGAECELCGGETMVVGVDDDAPIELRHRRLPEAERAHPGHARHKAREIAQQHGFVRPPVIVHSIARKLGFEVRQSHRLNELRARLVGQVIEVNATEPPVAQRFSVAHELGHHFLATRHGDGPVAEREADAFAGELLVPGPLLRAAVSEVTDLAELAARFKVSRQVLEIAAEHHRLRNRLT